MGGKFLPTGKFQEVVHRCKFQWSSAWGAKDRSSGGMLHGVYAVVDGEMVQRGVSTRWDAWMEDWVQVRSQF